MRIVYLFLLLLTTSVGFSQEDAWVYFTTKSNTQTYFDAPLQMLSQRALDRRGSPGYGSPTSPTYGGQRIKV